MIAIMHETAGRTLVVKATESLTSQDYEKVFIPQLNQLIGKFGKIRVGFYLAENFTGWELGAAWDDAVFGIQHRHDFEKVAVVSDKKWMEWATKIGSYFIDGQIATCTPAEFEDAVTWTKQ
ncbi:STAS/SEC14 domain-containing protein [Methylomicrobium lacus]|uniref:STAS/SEC14 domain-containing protein n=1 Tax=Methylomicrobium lacus TaxID=136992 RepID=UPI00045EBCC8|nr:STAS/SEC14 domain-containing protein [Methylomicrobium lacus]